MSIEVKAYGPPSGAFAQVYSDGAYLLTVSAEGLAHVSPEVEQAVREAFAKKGIAAVANGNDATTTSKEKT